MTAAAGSRTYRLIAAAVTAAAARRATGRGAYGPASPAVTAFLAAALSTAELDALTVRLYAVAPSDYDARSDLFAWERDWYVAALPAPPARVLVTAAGSGREVAALLRLGYAVDAFEPVPEFAAACAALPHAGTVVTTDHAAFAAALLDGGAGPAALFARQRYDAVVVGWCGLTHLLAAAPRARLLRACARAAPQGPVLASFFVVSAGGRDAGERRLGRVAAVLGRRLGRARRVAPAPAGVELLWHAGFRHRYSRGEIESLAGELGRDVLFAAEPCGHATFTPRAAAGPPSSGSRVA